MACCHVFRKKHMVPKLNYILFECNSQLTNLHCCVLWPILDGQHSSSVEQVILIKKGQTQHANWQIPSVNVLDKKKNLFKWYAVNKRNIQRIYIEYLNCKWNKNLKTAILSIKYKQFFRGTGANYDVETMVNSFVFTWKWSILKCMNINSTSQPFVLSVLVARQNGATFWWEDENFIK